MISLVDYGIQNEQSDIRAHVCPKVHAIYIFPTAAAIEAIERHPELEPRYAYQPGVTEPTALGWTMPCQWIWPIKDVRFVEWEKWRELNKETDLSKKGKLAVQCVLELMRLGKFPFWINAQEDPDRTVQVSGTDIIVNHKHRIQVKCDGPGGAKCRGGTGNLFLQFAERNPLGIH